MNLHIFVDVWSVVYVTAGVILCMAAYRVLVVLFEDKDKR